MVPSIVRSRKWFNATTFSRSLAHKNLIIPEPICLSNNVNDQAVSFVILRYESFATWNLVFWPFSYRNLPVSQRVFNYPLSRTRRMIECKFGILANEWRIFHRATDTSLDFSEFIIKACCILHMFENMTDILCRLYEWPL